MKNQKSLKNQITAIPAILLIIGICALSACGDGKPSGSSPSGVSPSGTSPSDSKPSDSKPPDNTPSDSKPSDSPDVFTILDPITGNDALYSFDYSDDIADMAAETATKDTLAEVWGWLNPKNKAERLEVSYVDVLQRIGCDPTKYYRDIDGRMYKWYGVDGGEFGIIVEEQENGQWTVIYISSSGLADIVVSPDVTDGDADTDTEFTPVSSNRAETAKIEEVWYWYWDNHMGDVELVTYDLILDMVGCEPSASRVDLESGTVTYRWYTPDSDEHDEDKMYYMQFAFDASGVLDYMGCMSNGLWRP